MFDGFKKYAPQVFNFAGGLVKQFSGPGGGKVSGQQVWDVARGAVQQFASSGADQPAGQQAWDIAQRAMQQFGTVGGDPSSRPPAQYAAGPFGPSTDAGQPAPAIASTPVTGPSPAFPGQPPAMSTPGYVSPPGSRFPFPSHDFTAPSPYGAWPGAQAGPNVDIGTLLQALQQRQIPALPGPFAQPAAVPQHNALTLLSLILANPNLQRTLQSAQMTGVAPRAVELPVPATMAPARTRSVPIPMGAIMNAIAALAGQSMTELNESTPEDDPEVPSYLVGDDGDFLVDPGSPNDRAALVAYLFRVSDQAQRVGYGQPPDTEDESEAWAEDAGFI